MCTERNLLPKSLKKINMKAAQIEAAMTTCHQTLAIADQIRQALNLP